MSGDTCLVVASMSVRKHASGLLHVAEDIVGWLSCIINLVLSSLSSNTINALSLTTVPVYLKPYLAFHCVHKLLMAVSCACARARATDSMQLQMVI